jgi:hypothetical protein
MSQNPYLSPDEATEPNQTYTLILPVTHDFILPQHCVVCDSEEAAMRQQTQESAPIMVPGLAVLRSRTFNLPYCETHAQACASRVRKFSLLQYGIFIGTFLLGYLAQTYLRGSHYAAIIVLSGFLLFVSTWVVKPYYLYDVRIKIKGRNILMKSRYAKFLQRVEEINSTQ